MKCVSVDVPFDGKTFTIGMFRPHTAMDFLQFRGRGIIGFDVLRGTTHLVRESDVSVEKWNQMMECITSPDCPENDLPCIQSLLLLDMLGHISSQTAMSILGLGWDQWNAISDSLIDDAQDCSGINGLGM